MLREFLLLTSTIASVTEAKFVEGKLETDKVHVLVASYRQGQRKLSKSVRLTKLPSHILPFRLLPFLPVLYYSLFFP